MKKLISLLTYTLVLTLGALLGALIFYLVINFVRDNEPFNYRLDYNLRKVAYNRYLDKVDKFSFLFANDYELDAATDSAKRYGKDYLAGFKANNDPRIGCDVRKRDFKLDLSLSDEQVTKDLTKLFGAGAAGFKVIDGAAVTTNTGLPAFQFNFNFTDPLNATMAVNQLLIPKDNQTYVLICGAGQAYFDKFASDFSVFFNSFRFEK